MKFIKLLLKNIVIVSLLIVLFAIIIFALAYLGSLVGIPKAVIILQATTIVVLSIIKTIFDMRNNT